MAAYNSEQRELREERHRELQEFLAFVDEQKLKSLDPSVPTDQFKNSKLLSEVNAKDQNVVYDPFTQAKPLLSRKLRSNTHLIMAMEEAMLRDKKNQESEIKKQQAYLDMIAAKI